MKTRSLPLSALLVALLSSWAFSAPAETAAAPEIAASAADTASVSPAAAVADSASEGAVATVATAEVPDLSADSASVPPADSVPAAAEPARAQGPDDAGTPSADDFAGKVVLFPPLIGDDVAERDGLVFALVYEAEKRFGSDLRRCSEECATLSCAVERGRAAGAARAIVPQIRRLGSKLFLTLSSVDFADGSKSSTARETFSVPEEFSTTARRALDALDDPDGASREITVENVTSADGPRDVPRQANAARYFGLKFGMMYPLADTYDWIEEREFRTEKRRIEVTQWEFGVSYWLFVNVGWAATLDLAVRGPNSGPDRYQFLFDVGGVHLFSAGDVSPFVGFGFGLQAGPEDEIGYELTNRHMGFSLNANAGIFFLRTYNFSLFLRGLYGIILNDDLDQKIAADFGMLLHANPLKKRPAASKTATAASASTANNANGANAQKGVSSGVALFFSSLLLCLLVVAVSD